MPEVDPVAVEHAFGFVFDECVEVFNIVGSHVHGDEVWGWILAELGESVALAGAACEC